MTPDQERPDERLGDRPGFEEWADEVVGAVEGRRRDQQDGDSPQPGTAPAEGKRRRRRKLPFLQGLFQRRV